MFYMAFGPGFTVNNRIRQNIFFVAAHGFSSCPAGVFHQVLQRLLYEKFVIIRNADSKLVQPVVPDIIYILPRLVRNV